MITQDIDTLTIRFLDEWQGDGLPVVYDLQPQADHPDGYIHFSVKMGGSRHAYGDAKSGGKKQIGRVWIDVVVPDEEGTARGTKLIEDFCAIFRNWTDNIIQCETEDMSQPYTIDGGLVRFSASVPFTSIRPYS